MITVDCKGNQVEVYKYAFHGWARDSGGQNSSKYLAYCPVSGSQVLAELRKNSEFYLFARNAKVINHDWI